jgi:hypothetical protein
LHIDPGPEYWKPALRKNPPAELPLEVRLEGHILDGIQVWIDHLELTLLPEDFMEIALKGAFSDSLRYSAEAVSHFDIGNFRVRVTDRETLPDLKQVTLTLAADLSAFFKSSPRIGISRRRIISACCSRIAKMCGRPHCAHRHCQGTAVFRAM